MTLTLLAVRTGDEADSALYPVVSRHRRPVVLEVGDGEPHRATAKGLTLYDQTSGRRQALAGLRDLRIDVVLTDARLAFACEGFEAGGGWVGWAPGAVAASVLTRGLDVQGVRRRAGRVLVGQVRHPWLRAAGFRPGAGWFAEEQLRLAVTTQAGGVERELLLDLELPKGEGAEELCRALVSRAAAHRLEHTPCEPDERRTLEGLLEPPRVQPPRRDRFAVYHFPRYYLISAPPSGRGPGTASLPACAPTPTDNRHRPPVEPL